MIEYREEVEKYIKYMPYDNFEYAVNVSLKNKYVYVETPKVACSTIKGTLQRIELEHAELVKTDPNDIHDRRYSPLLKPSQTCGLDRLINNPEYFVFCFVRNPYTRLLSSYLDKIEKNKHVKWSILYAMGEDVKKLDKKVSFSDFVDVVCELDVYDMDPHWRVQYYHTFQEEVNYDFIGKLEKFSEDVDYALSKIIHNYRDFYRLKVEHSTKSNEMLSKYYKDDLQEKVYNKFKVDFDYFEYDKDVEVR